MASVVYFLLLNKTPFGPFGPLEGYGRHVTRISSRLRAFQERASLVRAQGMYVSTYLLQKNKQTNKKLLGFGPLFLGPGQFVFYSLFYY